MLLIWCEAPTYVCYQNCCFMSIYSTFGILRTFSIDYASVYIIFVLQSLEGMGFEDDY